MAPGVRLVVTCEVPFIPDCVNATDEKAGEVDTCTEYEVAPVMLSQVRGGVADCPVAPLAGERGVTRPMVVKLHTDDQGEIVPFVNALACQ